MKIETRYRKIVNVPDIKGGPLFRKISELEPKSVLQPIPITWEKASDCSVFDDRGNKYIDLTSGIFVANCGHSNPAVKRALKKQIDADLMFVYNYPTRIKYKLLKKILEISPAHFNCVMLLMTGSEAVDAAYKLIKQWAQKNGKRYIVTFKGSYHGRGLSNDLICGNENKASWSGVSDPDIYFIDFPYDGGIKFDTTKLPPHDEIAAFMLETFQGWGAWFYPDGYVNDLYAFARKIGALVCFDEMQSGFYRLGPVYGYMTYGTEIKPDIICLGKGMSSSLPMAAVLTRKSIADINTNSDLHGTHSGNPLCCAASYANLEFLSAPGRLEKMKKSAAVFEKEISALASVPGVRRGNVRGMIAGLIFDTVDLATDVVNECVVRGVLPVCTKRNSVKLAPPLTISPAAIKEAAEVVRAAILKCVGAAERLTVG